MVKNFWVFALFVLLSLSTSIVNAGTAYWTDWQSSDTSGVSGIINLDLESVDVTFSGAYSFAQTNGGTNYWSPSAPYESTTVENAPPASDIIALSQGGSVTVDFSKPVMNPLIALVSWNGNTVEFGEPITFLSQGWGYFRRGTPEINTEGTGFYGNGEVHGVIQLTGVHSSFSFTHTSEHWHGLTVGAISSVPVPGSLMLLGSGLIGVFALRRRSRSI